MLNRKLTDTSLIESKNCLDSKVNEINDNFIGVEFSIEVLCDDESNKKGIELSTVWFDVAVYLQKKNCYALNFKRFSHHPYGS